MNDYEMTAESYKSLLARDDCRISKEKCNSMIKVYTMLSELTSDEIIEIFNCGAYNDILKSYCKQAMQNCDIDDNKINEVMQEIKYLLDTVSAKEISR